MARYWFGGGVADWSLDTVTVSGTANLAQVAGGATMTFWTAEVGGSQYTDLLDSDGVAVTVIESADGTVARAAGQIPPLQGPNEVREMWASANDGPRALLVARVSAVARSGDTMTGPLVLADGSPAASEAYVGSAVAAVVILPAPNGTDDTAAINAVLAANAGKALIGRPGAAYRISAPLVIYSGTTLDMTSCTVTLLPGSNCNMLQNRAVTTTRRVLDAAMTSGSGTLTSATGAFTSADVGKAVTVQGAGAAGVPLTTTIGSVPDGSTAILAATAGATVTGQYAAVGPPDSNIAVRGGTWVRGTNAGSGTALHTLMFRRVDGLVVRDLTVSAASGKYLIAPGDVTNFKIEGITCDGQSPIGNSGVQINGPAARGHIRDIYGYTSDDLVALTARDYTTYEDVFGDITDVHISNINPNGSMCALKVISGTGIKVRRVVADGIHGTTYQTPVRLWDDQAGPSDLDLTVANVDTRPGSTYQLVDISCTLGRRIVLRNLSWVAGTNNTYGVRLDKAAVVENLVIDGLDVPSSAVGATGLLPVNVGSGTVRNLSVSRLSSYGQVGLGALIYINAATGVVDHLAVDGVEWRAAAGSGAPVVYHNGTLGHASINGVRITGGGGRLLRVTATAVGTTVVELGHVHVVQGWDLGDIRAPLELHLGTGTVDTVDTGALIKLIGATASLVVRGGGAFSNVQNRAGVSRDGTQSIRVVAPQFPVDLAIVAKNNGDAARNTNAALACGLGPAVSNGTNWKNVYTDAIY